MTTQIRIKDIIAFKIKHISNKNLRSFNKQIEFILMQFIKDYEKVNGEIILEDNEE